jgi:hypothetical protein
MCKQTPENDKSEKALRLIDQFKRERRKGSVTVHFDGSGSAVKLECRQVL